MGRIKVGEKSSKNTITIDVKVDTSILTQKGENLPTSGLVEIHGDLDRGDSVSFVGSNGRGFAQGTYQLLCC